MSGVPLPIPKQTTYSLLNLGPEATAQEISHAIQERASELKAGKSLVDRQLSEIFGKIPGLEQLSLEVQKLRAIGQPEEQARLQEAEAQLRPLEARATALNPAYASLLRQLADLEVRIRDNYLISLQNPEEHLKYDRLNPPLELLKLSERGRDTFTESRTALPLVRRELVEFLEGQGEVVFHPSDLTRQDFTDDYTYHPRLDDLLI